MKKCLRLSCGVVLGAVAVLSLVAGSSLAQGDPSYAENHYKVYELSAPVPAPVVGPVLLRDQFSSVTIDQLMLEKFAIPAEKEVLDGTGEVYQIVDPMRHYTWWKFDNPELVRRVDALDQFGGYSWRLRNSVYLLTPAGKNQTQYPEGANHYKCYVADDAPVVEIEVRLADQVDSVVVAVLQGEFFCNPVEKEVDGVIYPIVDDLTHMTCYRVDNPTPYDVVYTVVDQFGMRDIVLANNMYLCLPAEKGTVVGDVPSTWGRIKALYR